MSQSVEITKDGMKLSYLRFLSDSAPGYLMIILCGAVILFRLPMPFFGTSWLHALPNQLSNEAQIFFLILLFLLATPIGLMLNALGWFLLGALPISMLRFWFWLPRPAAFPLLGTKRSLCWKDTIKFFELEAAGKHAFARFYEQANLYEALLGIYFPAVFDQLNHKRGLRRFCRSCAVLALMVSLYSILTINELRLGGISAAVFCLLIIFLSLLEYDQFMDVLFRVYVLSSKLHKDNPTREQVITNLIESSKI